jgi:NADPH-dependent glutamate synthase beta subunit-like oxidoreductase
MSGSYCVAVFGGAVAGSEAANQLAKSGINVVVFEQNALPYGKIETGLPKWHIKLRDKQEEKIDSRLDNPQVFFVPNCVLGRDIEFDDVVNNWGFNAILLATGAWKDRPLPLEGIENYLGKGFYYQNPFVQWFNLYHDPAYDGPQFEIQDGAIIIGGGLASIDVAKILMIETFRYSAEKRGKKMDTNTIEHLGLPKAAERLGIDFDNLNLKGCTIYYRRRIIDMPLSPWPESELEEDIQKCYDVRKKIVQLASEKFLFKMQQCYSPLKTIVENGRLTGLIMRRNKIENGSVIPLADITETVKTPLTISSIGSIPEPIPGISQTGEKFNIEDEFSGKLKGFENVFALGNAVTGKGNIKESQGHGRQVSESLIKNYLGIQNEDENREMEIKTGIEKQMGPVNRLIKQSKPLSGDQLDYIIKKVKNLQQKAGYDGNYMKWIGKHLPARLEKMEL